MPDTGIHTKLINDLLFQAAWLVCVLGAAAGHLWMAAAAEISEQKGISKG